MADEAEARVACPTPAKHRYATLEAADRDRIRLGSAAGRKLIAYDNCPCGWVHLATQTPPAGVGASVLTTGQIIQLSHDEFNQLVRADVRGSIQPETAKALRDTSLNRAWKVALKLFQQDLNLQKQQKAGDRNPDVVLWRQRIDKVVLTVSERMAEASNIAALSSQRKNQEQGVQIGPLKVLTRSDDEIDQKVVKMMAGELAAEKLKRKYIDEYMLLVAAEYKRFGIPLTKAMKIAVGEEEA